MKIGVVSDTHLQEPTDQFKRLIELHFKHVDKIFHAGDFTEWRIAEYLSNQKDLLAVSGNMDPPQVREALPSKRVIQLGGFTVGLIHGGGPPFGIESRIREEFDRVDAIVYGHTHTAANHRARGILFFNPGSPTRSFSSRGTIGVLHLGGKIAGEIITL